MQKHLKNWGKQLICTCICLMALCTMAGSVGAAEETAPAQTTATADAAQTAGTGKAGKVIGFLVIFTVVCGGTAYVVMRPSLKKLREAKKQAAATKPESEEK